MLNIFTEIPKSYFNYRKLKNDELSQLKAELKISNPKYYQDFILPQEEINWYQNNYKIKLRNLSPKDIKWLEEYYLLEKSEIHFLIKNGLVIKKNGGNPTLKLAKLNFKYDLLIGLILTALWIKMIYSYVTDYSNQLAAIFKLNKDNEILIITGIAILTGLWICGFMQIAFFSNNKHRSRKLVNKALKTDLKINDNHSISSQ